ncbi:MAG: 4Fe-4S dicluster-binding protein [Chloroflexota bacterium]|nr:4Fe-4S dicluster-binding protein [Chloroflexota bacterium]
MSDEVYHKLAKVLDTLPNSFPSTPNGLEIRLLKKVFTPEEADLFCDLRLIPETAQQIAERTGRPLEGLGEKLISMWQRGEIFGISLGDVTLFRMVPWVVGIYEFQVNRMDREFAQMCEEYSIFLGPPLVMNSPKMMQVIPVEKEIPAKQEALSYEQVSTIMEMGQSFAVNQCICKKEQGLLDNACKKPQEVCMAIAPMPGVMDNHPWGGRVISKEEAYEVLRRAEEAGLVHLTSNYESGNWFICNCCGCCCMALRAVRMGITNAINSHYYAEIDQATCISCGICANDRCQIHAIEEKEDSYRVNKERCIGCGLCVSTCPAESVRLVQKPLGELEAPAKDEQTWFEERARSRGVDISAYM